MASIWRTEDDCEENQVAIEAKKGPNELVSKEEVERVVRELMEGESGVETKKRMKELMQKAHNAMSEGGSSYKTMATVASLWKQKDCTTST